MDENGVFDQNAEMIFDWFIDGASGPHLNRDMSTAAYVTAEFG